MASFVDPQNGDLATAEHVAQLVEDFSGLRNIPIAISGINDPAQYALTLKNAGTGSRDLIAYAADGTTVLLQVDASGVTLGAPVNLPPGSISGTAIAAGSITNAMLGADVARANLLTNGGFEQWQRGSGPFTTSPSLGPDLWSINVTSGTISVSRDTTNVDTGSLACAAVVTTGVCLLQQFQVVATDGAQIRGRTFSASVRARTTTANAVRIGLTTDGAGGTTVFSAYHAGSGAYAMLSATTTVPTNATYMVLRIYFDAACTAYVDNAMLVVGSQAANYVPMHPADDLARCLRYYHRNTTTAADSFYATMQAASTTSAYGVYYVPVPMAVTPTLTIFGSGQFALWQSNTTRVSCSTGPAPYGGMGTTTVGLNATVSAGLVAGNASMLVANTGGTWLALEANP